MQVGDLIKLSMAFGDVALRGIILDIYEDPYGEFESKLLSVLWSDGDKTEEFPVDVEVVKKNKLFS